MNAQVEPWQAQPTYAAGDGATLSYRITGTGEQAIVLLHSLALDGSWFAPLAQRLAGQYRVLAPDFRGHGANADADGQISLAGLADDVRAAMRDAGIESATVLGISMGGMVAQAFAAKFPEATDGAILIAATAAYDEAARAGAKARADAARAGLEPMADTIIARWFGEPQDRDAELVEFAARGRAQFLANDPEIHAQFLEAMTAVGDFTVPASVPTLVIAGVEDASTPVAVLEGLAASLPHSRLQKVSGGHLVAFTHPGDIAEQITGFLDRADAR